MATRPDNKHAVIITPAQGPSVLLLIDGSGAAQALTDAINQTDATAVNEGMVRELPMVINGDIEPLEARHTFSRDFRRVMSDRKLLEVRELTRIQEDEEGDEPGGIYWTAVALWGMIERPAGSAVTL